MHVFCVVTSLWPSGRKFPTRPRQRRERSGLEDAGRGGLHTRFVVVMTATSEETDSLAHKPLLN